MEKNRTKRYILIVTVLVIVAICVEFYYPLRSYLVMSIYSRKNYKESAFEENNLDIDIKGGTITSKKDWYPFVNIYDTSDEFSYNIGRDVNITILYNFGAFDGKSSRLYDDKSRYFAGFYGAYVIQEIENPDKKYGFKDDVLEIDEIMEAFEFDYKYLVLEDLGCINPVFDVHEYDIKYDTSYLGYDDWVRIDTKLKSNSPSHERIERKLGYIQYGPPITNDKPDFFEIELYGRMYARHFEEFNSTILIFVMGIDEVVIDECDDMILSKTIIRSRK